MNVLMLGWEYPPFISGGLGTACHGLTSGLSALGVEVTFVIPRPVCSTPVAGVKLAGTTHASSAESHALNVHVLPLDVAMYPVLPVSIVITFHI